DYKAYTLFLYNFMKYIEWPDPTGDFVIGVMGDSPIKNDLKTLSENKKAKGRKIVVKILATADDAAGCNMIYIPSEKSSFLKPIADKMKGKSVLIVAEREGLAKKGAAISFMVDEDDTLKFDINKSVIDSQSLKIANVLIQLGILVG
ncbi:MAG TPA: YfiR family protein, partial [Bacteroidia bacterium]